MTGRNSLLEPLLKDISACRICRDRPKYGAPLPHEPRPVCVADTGARVLVAGQAPGTRVHETGIPFNDASGNRLREWMGVDRETFYDRRRIAIVPMGFCFPGQDDRGADLPPRRECREQWHDQVFSELKNLQLLLVIGLYAHNYYLDGKASRSLTETVERWREFRHIDSRYVIYPLPHPSWRNNGWIKKHTWFEAELLPQLRADIAHALSIEN
ncbi:uracil-DNA glycosylase family protein [Hoeflea sp. WL0058]|uniref:Uracil-DNA glycosylase family protein n=1 Tax=Flavimaribacter sediminis TaxID=2865987 RepID=A0AAE2ZKN1_9HYPH|nr:uracil-DNA glycosylase family protein [Flavimaribacter sediminis]MBW8636402.1 uracil-DNA glycosylase family protein [Flavimaribacter sediminis]